jgi:hypothetical protein
LPQSEVKHVFPFIKKVDKGEHLCAGDITDNYRTGAAPSDQQELDSHRQYSSALLMEHFLQV